MAKSNDAAVDAFLADVIATIPEDKRDAFKEALTDGAKSKLREGVLARSDYSRQSDELRKEREAFNATVAEANRNIDGWKDWYKQTATETASMKERLEKYSDTYGDLDEGVKNKKPSLDLDAVNKNIDERLKDRDAAAIGFADQLTDLKIDHWNKYKEKLNTADLLKICDADKVNLTQGYKTLTAEREETARKKEFDDAVKSAREEGAKEYASKHNIPFSPAPTGPSVMDAFTNKDIPRTHRDRVSAAISDFNDQMASRPR